MKERKKRKEKIQQRECSIVNAVHAVKGFEVISDLALKYCVIILTKLPK
jgi:hypothetical protein